MNTDQFWTLIDGVHKDSGGDMDRKCELLKEQLTALPEADLPDFIHHFDQADHDAYNWPLWGAAYVMNGGCSDDSFSDFRATLISRGREVYEAAQADPDSLASLDFKDEEDIYYEGFQYVMHVVAEERLGGIPDRTVVFPDGPAGAEWDDDDLDSLYPKLTAKFNGAPEETGPDSKRPWWKFW